MVDNQGTDTSQSANEMFDESVFTDTPQEVAPESSVDNTLTPTDAFTTQTGEEAPEAAPSETQEQPQPLEAKNDDTRFQYWQSQAAQKDNQIQQMQQQFMNQKEAAISALEAQLIKKMAAEEQERSGLEEKDPLVKLKQQEIDLKAAELQQKGEHDQTKMLMETAVDAEKLDLEREKMQSTNELGLVKESFGLMKEGQKDTTAEIKENVAALRDKEKNRSNEKIAAMRERAAARKANGKTKDK